MSLFQKIFLLLVCFSWLSCASVIDENTGNKVQVVNLFDHDQADFTEIRNTFQKRNPGYDIQYFHAIKQIKGMDAYRIAFLQKGGGTASLNSGESSKVSVGDIILLNKKVSLKTDSLLDLLVFTVPDSFSGELPVFIRPDWDLNITDVPGGCATDSNAYRRILLTWEEQNGPYLYHALNAHRVRIMNSFSHFHPLDIGFDEFYLVQMALPDAQILTSEKTDQIIHPEEISKEDLPDLIQKTSLQVGDLVYLPRGVIHRGFGGVLAQVITVPGFIPGSEIGVDHHLKKINEKFNLTGAEALPFYKEAADQMVIK